MPGDKKQVSDGMRSGLGSMSLMPAGFFQLSPCATTAVMLAYPCNLCTACLPQRTFALKRSWLQQHQPESI